MVFPDIHPLKPIHLLIIPKKHIKDLLMMNDPHFAKASRGKPHFAKAPRGKQWQKEYNYITARVRSSVVERHSHTMEVGGSIPPAPTKLT